MIKEGTKFLTFYNDEYTFLGWYDEGRDSDFIAKDKNGQLRNFTEDMVKKWLDDDIKEMEPIEDL